MILGWHLVILIRIKIGVFRGFGSNACRSCMLRAHRFSKGSTFGLAKCSGKAVIVHCTSDTGCGPRNSDVNKIGWPKSSYTTKPYQTWPTAAVVKSLQDSETLTQARESLDGGNARQEKSRVPFEQNLLKLLMSESRSKWSFTRQQVSMTHIYKQRAEENT